MNEVKAVRKQTRRAMYLTEVVVRLVSPYITSVANSLFVLPNHVPMRELRAMESEARLVDAPMLPDMTDSAIAVSVEAPYRKQEPIQRMVEVDDEISHEASAPPRPSCCGSRSR